MRWGGLAAAAVVLLAAAVAVAAPALPDRAWVLALPDTARLPGPAVRLADLNTEPVPAGAGALLLAGEGRPGQSVTLDRRVVLRRLVEAGEAAGVARLAGAARCVVLFTGAATDAAQVTARVETLLQALLPPAPAGAPASWLELELKVPPVVAADWQVALVDPRPLRPGRNLIAVRIEDGGRATRLGGSVVCHVYGEIATARAGLPGGSVLAADQFAWEWRDLTTVAPGLAVGRAACEGLSLARSLAVGEGLRRADLRATPLVRQGEAVDLAVRRGAVVVTVRATARQDGVLGDLVTVRNDTNGKLAMARVAGPGLVEWRR